MNKIITGCDSNQEWLLSWWYDNYIKHNDYDVIWIDFGCSENGNRWMRQHGTVVQIRPERPLISWHYKPQAMIKSLQYGSNNVWIDLDCEIRGSVRELYGYGLNGIGVSREIDRVTKKTVSKFATGVVAFSQDCENYILRQWNHECLNGYNRGDQDAFNKWSIHFQINEIPYRWQNLRWQINNDAKIIHWHGKDGKLQIAKYIMEENK